MDGWGTPGQDEAPDKLSEAEWAEVLRRQIPLAQAELDALDDLEYGVRQRIVLWGVAASLAVLIGMLAIVVAFDILAVPNDLLMRFRGLVWLLKEPEAGLLLVLFVLWQVIAALLNLLRQRRILYRAHSRLERALAEAEASCAEFA